MHGHKIENQNATHFLTFTVVAWIDVFTRDDYRKIIIDSLFFCQKEKGLCINAYVIMSNHIHLVCHVKEPFLLSDVIRDFKKFTSKAILDFMLMSDIESRKEWMIRLFKYYAKYNKNNKDYQFWQHHNMPIELESPKWIKQKLDYIHLNPVRNGIVLEAEDYVYSSARTYAGRSGYIDIEKIELDNIVGYVS